MTTTTKTLADAMNKAEAIRNSSSDPAMAKTLAELADLYLAFDSYRRATAAGIAFKVDPDLMVAHRALQNAAAEKMIRFCRKHCLPIP